MCWGNYATFDGLMNGANGSLKASTTYCEKTIIWIMFQNYKIGTLTKKKYFNGLSLNELVFDPTNVKTYGLTYIAFFRIQTKEKMYLLAPLQHENFYVDLRIHIEMNRLKIIATWMPLIPQLKTYVILM